MAMEETDCSMTLAADPNAEGSGSLTLRVIMQGKEAGSIIGKKGDNVKRFREESGAKINISDSSCPERIVTVTGTADQIFKAFAMICKKFEEDINNIYNTGLPKPPVTIRMIIPASQCGSLIGKGGTKIKEIREMTGASIQVASEMLPNSTERAVTVSGTADAITQCIYNICCVMLESPPKGSTIPYRPKPSIPAVMYAGGQAFALQGQYAMPAHPDPSMGAIHYGTMPQLTKMALQQGMMPGMPVLSAQPGMMPAAVGGIPPGYLPARHSPPGPGPNSTQTHEMAIPNDLIGCIIGRGGSKINEIRNLSGASIKIANVEEGSADRKVTVTGTPETINAAEYLINASLEMHKNLTLDPTLTPSSAAAAALTSVPIGPVGLPPSIALAMPLGTLYKGGGAPVMAAPAMAAMAAMAAPAMAPGAPMLGLNVGMLETLVAQRKPLMTKMKGGLSPHSPAVAAATATAMKKNGNKFAPY